MTAQDRHSVEDFAKRYKFSEKELTRLCEAAGFGPDTVITRDEFRQIVEELRGNPEEVAKPQSATIQPSKSTKVEKEEKVKEEEKISFEQLAAKHKLTTTRKDVLKFTCGWDDKSKISEAELQAAINKHLLDK